MFVAMSDSLTHYSGRQARAAEWLEALEKGLNREFPGGVRGSGLKLMSPYSSGELSVVLLPFCQAWFKLEL